VYISLLVQFHIALISCSNAYTCSHRLQYSAFCHLLLIML